MNEEEQIAFEEGKYRTQLKHIYGYLPGDPRLKSSDKIKIEEEE